MYFTDEPAVDAERYAEKQQRALGWLPTCNVCGRHIQEDYLFDVDGSIFCEQCMEKLFKKEVDGYAG